MLMRKCSHLKNSVRRLSPCCKSPRLRRVCTASDISEGTFKQSVIIEPRGINIHHIAQTSQPADESCYALYQTFRLFCAAKSRRT
jgi:hypothetical protein